MVIFVNEMTQYDKIRIEDYSYDLPEERIAKYPLPYRDSSKLLHYKDGRIDDHVFSNLPEILPEDSLMVFNDTKVVPARLFFKRETGAVIEVFCLEPVTPAEYNLAFAADSSCSWKCVIGNAKRWKSDVLTFINTLNDPALGAVNLRASLISREGQTGIVNFTWEGSRPFSEILDMCGKIPIPPYLNRDTEALDYERYQTTYARIRGSVAAPTAGLHFTPEVLERIRQRGISTQTVCLHVGAGTFLPVKSSLVREHPMHREPFTVPSSLIRSILEGRNLVAVGTTSVRTLESLYYIGAGLLEGRGLHDVEQSEPYDREWHYSTKEALEAILDYLEEHSLQELSAGTRIIIVPGFRFRIVDMMVTNFHQPQSTLLLLISAFVNGDWRSIYDHALAGGYRFLSYGDSSLLERPINK